MDEDKISVSNIPVSFLEPVRKNTQLSANDLFLVSLPVVSNDMTVGYVSKSVRYETLARSVSSSLDIGGIEQRIDTLSGNFKVDETLNYLTALTTPSDPIPTVISALRENNRGQIVSISGYVLSNALTNILNAIVLPKVNATTSPWVSTSSVKSVTGTSTTNVASQKLATDIYNNLTGNYVLKSDVKSVIGTSEQYIASQKLARDLSAEISSKYIKTSDIKTNLTLPILDSNVASQSLANSLSDAVKNNYFLKSNVVNELGTSTEKAASQSLISAISGIVESDYINKYGTESFVPKADVVSQGGTSTTKVASQALATAVSVDCMTEIYKRSIIGQEGQVYYLSSDGSAVKQTIMDLNIYVCENNADIASSKSAKLNFIDVFNSWQRGGTYNGTWFGYNAGYSGGNRPGFSAWKYDDDKKSICQPVNTTDYSFYISPMDIDKYEILLRCYSTNTDDDLNGFIAAFAEDSRGNPHTLSFIRTPNYGNVSCPFQYKNHWTCIIDFLGNTNDFTYAENSQKILLSAWTDDDTNAGRWNDGTISCGTLIKIKRDGNMITAWTSLFKGNNLLTSDILNETEFVVNLNTLTAAATRPSEKTTNNGHGVNYANLLSTLEVFRGRSKIGFSTLSQPDSFYELSTFIIPKMIVDARTNKLSSYYNGTMQEDTTTTASRYVGLGRLSKNLATNKTFYSTQNGFVKFAQY